MQKPRINWRRFTVIVLIVTAIVSAGVFGAVKLADLLDTFKNGSENVEGIDTNVKDGVVNCLIVGVDYEGLRTDVIMLASYNLKENKIRVLSIPRDTRVIINNRVQKINAAHALKKVEGTVEEVKKLTGIPIHYYVKLDFKGFRGVIDVLDGVDYNVPQRMYYVDPTQNLYIDLQPGMQHLNGNKAEQLVRFRRYPLGDVDRIKVQQDFLHELVKQKMTPAIITKIPSLFDEMSKYMQTNIGAKEVVEYAKILKTFTSDGLETYQLPGEGRYIGDVSYFICDKAKTETLIHETFGYPNAVITTAPVNGSSSTPKPSSSTATAKPSTSTSTSNPSTSASPKPTASSNPSTSASPKPTASSKPSTSASASPKPTSSPKATETAKPSSGSKDTDEKDDLPGRPINQEEEDFSKKDE